MAKKQDKPSKPVEPPAKPVKPAAPPPLPVAEPVAAAPIAAPAPPEPPKNRTSVYLNNPVPLPHNPLVVDTTDQGTAWKAFCQANGIDSSDNPKTFTAVE